MQKKKSNRNDTKKKINKKKKKEAHIHVFIYQRTGVCVRDVRGDGMLYVLLRGSLGVRVTVSVKSTYCTGVTAALCIRYFPLHLAVILVPNEITHKSPKVLTTQASGPESQSSQGSI